MASDYIHEPCDRCSTGIAKLVCIDGVRRCRNCCLTDPPGNPVRGYERGMSEAEALAACLDAFEGSALVTRGPRKVLPPEPEAAPVVEHPLIVHRRRKREADENQGDLFSD